MEFLILGPLEVADDGDTLALGGPKQRAVLAHLILRANQVVPADLLIDGLWGEEPPESARNTLQTYVYRLRKLLGEDRIGGRDGGYVLAAAPGEIDAERFEALVKQGKAQVASDPAAAAATLSDALSLWRADALADVTEEPSLRGEAARLEELRLSATEHRVAAEIAMGAHSTVVPELESLTVRYPLRERMWANLMLALHRSGRQAEALSTYERARQVLADELGADPSPELQRLHEQILHRAPEVAMPESPRPTVRPSRIDLRPGTEFAGYRIERALGRGGMSVVYLAEQERLRRKVALKILAPQLAEDERFRERFERESRLAASLDHPNVIPIYEAGASGGDLFIAMRYVEGTDLRTLLHEGGALEPSRAIAIVRQVAAALDAAHEQGLVHRDVKPGNVLLARQRGSEAGGHVYLSDFGLTKRSASDSGITGTGQFVGTLDYAAPEQFKGGTPDARTDVYSLGCVLFECLTGHPPFASENDAGLMYAHLQAPPPSATAARLGLPREIDGVVAKAMAKAPADRYPAAGTLADEASRALVPGAHGVTGDGPPQRRTRWLVPTIAVALALVVGVVVSSMLRGDGPQPRSQGSRPPLVTLSPTLPPVFRTVQRPLSPDERRLLTYIPEGVTGDCSPLDRDEPIQGELATLICRTDDVEVLYELFPTDDLMDAAFQINVNGTTAPKGECATEDLAVTSYTVGSVPAGRVLCYTIHRAGDARFGDQGLDQSHIEWTDENASIYAHAVRQDLGDLSLYEWWLESSGPNPPSSGTATALAKDRGAAAAPRLRDGSYLVSLRHPVDRADNGTYGIHIEDGEYEMSFDGTVDQHGSVLLKKVDGIIFDPEACPTAFLGSTDGGLRPAEFAWSARGDSITWKYQEGGVCAGPQGGLERFTWTRAPAGVIAVEKGGEIVLVDADGFGVEDLTADAETDPNFSPDWSSDGSMIVFAGAGRDYDLYVMNADGTDVRQLTDEIGDELQPAWSPDGQRIAFAFDDLGGGTEFRSGVVVVNTDGTGWTELVMLEGKSVYQPVWSPDGDRIAFSAFDAGGHELYVMDADGTDLADVHEQSRGVIRAPMAWTPDGRRIVFWGEGPRGETLLSMRPDGTEVRGFVGELPPGDGGLSIDWSPDGRWVVIAGLREVRFQTGSSSKVYLMRADGSMIFTISSLGSEATWRPEAG